MLWSMKSFRGYHIHATDGNIGRVQDMLFDDREWVFRHAVVDTGQWLPGRTVLLPPSTIGRPDPEAKVLPVALTKRQVDDSPLLSTDEPVSRRHEARLYEFYGLEPYWVGGIAGGEFPPPKSETDEFEKSQQPTTSIATATEGDPDLRSCNEVIGYHIQATDGEIGHVSDLIGDDDNWIVRYIAVDTRNWLPGREVLMAVDWVHKVSWEDSKVFVDLPLEKIANSPEWEPGSRITREYEKALYEYYGRPGYWVRSADRSGQSAK